MLPLFNIDFNFTFLFVYKSLLMLDKIYNKHEKSDKIY